MEAEARPDAQAHDGSQRSLTCRHLRSAVSVGTFHGKTHGYNGSNGAF